MVRGDLGSTPLTDVLRQLADSGSTGCLALQRDVDPRAEAQIHLADGEVYAAEIADGSDAGDPADDDDRLRIRLLAAGHLTQAAWDDALEAREELLDWTVGELLVELGHLDAGVLADFAAEDLLDAVTRVAGWSVGSYRFRLRERTRRRAGRAYRVTELLDIVAARTAEWQQLSRLLPPDAAPVPGDAKPAGAEGFEAAVLAAVDGIRDVSRIAAACGGTELEAARALLALSEQEAVRLPDVEPDAAAPDAAEDEDPLTRWSAALEAALPPPVEEEIPLVVVSRVRSDIPVRPAEDVDPETAERRARLRSRAAEELVAAQRELESLREAVPAAPVSIVTDALDDAETTAADVAATDAPEVVPDDREPEVADAALPVVLDEVDPVDPPVAADDADLAAPEAEAPAEHDPALAAVLLRELSNLGLDEEPSPPARPMHPGMPARVPAARATADQGARKRRGIFGR